MAGGERTEVETTLLSGEAGGGPTLPLDARIGRFTVLEPLGAGGMGIVVAAHDPQLDRRVALKLVRGDALQARGRDRLLREGQAMAQLTHPNVLTVYEAGVVGDDVFLVMELVEGRSLRAVLAARPHRWRDVLELLLAAGRGLAAAHRAGLVHRDFKPDNVLVGDDGRVRVMDFGLVAADTDDPPAAPAPSALVLDLTRTGSVMGTPIYMSPEQHLGLAVDAQADQWAFCVSLYEALWGRTPFAGETLEEIRDNVLAGRIREPGAAPAHLRRIVMRGLRRQPDERHESMDALLAELAAVPVRRRRVALAGLGIGGIAAVTTALIAVSGASPRPCGDSARHFDGVWDAAARDRLTLAFEQSGAPFAADAVSRVIAGLDAYRTGWVRAHVETCEATAVHREQSPQALDLRMECLDRRLGEARALIRLLEQADVTIVERAGAAVSGLPPVSACDDATQLAGPAPPPAGADPAAVAEVETAVADARALVAAGRYPAAIERATGARDDAKAQQLLALEGEALLLIGEARDGMDRADAAPMFFDAAIAAQTAGDDATAADAWTRLAKVNASTLARFDDAERWVQVADSLVRRLHDDRRQVALHEVRAIVLERRGRPADALAEWRAALALHDEHGGDPIAGAMLHYNLGAVLQILGKLDEALAELDVAQAQLEAAQGAQHPAIASVISVRADVQFEQGHPEQARETRREAIERLERAFPAGSPSLTYMHGRYADDLYLTGSYQEALDLHQRVVALLEAELGADHPDVATERGDIAITLLAMGRYAESLAIQEQVLELRERVLGKDHPDVALALFYISTAKWYSGVPAEGIEPALRAAEIMEKVYGPDHTNTLEYQGQVGAVLRAAGKTDEARAVLVKLVEDQRRVLGPDHPSVAYTEAEIGNLETDPAISVVHYQRSADILERALGPDHPNFAAALMGLGASKLSLLRFDEARQDLERAIAIMKAGSGDPSFVADAQMQLAEVERQAGRRAIALELARTALAGYGDDPAHAAKRTFLEGWLRRHGR